jgi:hypothetical protein
MHTQMPIPQTQSEWNREASLLPDFDDQTTNEYYGYSPSQNHGNSGFSRSQNYNDVPRTWPSPYETRIVYDNTITPKTYEPSNYMVDVDKQDSQGTNSTVTYDAQDSSRDFARLSISRSPKIKDETVITTMPLFDKSPGSVMPSRESSNDSGNSSREMTVADVEDHGADEPYAKLIYRALMSAPNHSMVLQEIYQWFRDNTAKGSSDTKGWMNSIRHNLSMNAVRAIHSFFENILTFYRHSRRQSGKSLAMRPRSRQNGFWKTSRSKMVFSLLHDTARARVTKSSSSPKTLPLRDKVLAEKGASAQARRSSHARKPKTTVRILGVLFKG